MLRVTLWFPNLSHLLKKMSHSSSHPDHLILFSKEKQISCWFLENLFWHRYYNDVTKRIVVFLMNWDMWSHSSSFKTIISNFMVKWGGIFPFFSYILTLFCYDYWVHRWFDPVWRKCFIPKQPFHASALRSGIKMNHINLHRRHIHSSVTISGGLLTLVSSLFWMGEDKAFHWKNQVSQIYTSNQWQNRMYVTHHFFFTSS